MQRALALFLATLGGVLITGAIFWALGEMIDNVSEYQTAQDRCLKQATTYQEARQCR